MNYHLVNYEMRQLKVREMQILNEMANFSNDMFLKMGKISGKEWNERNIKNEQQFLEQLSNIKP